LPTHRHTVAVPTKHNVLNAWAKGRENPKNLEKEVFMMEILYSSMTKISLAADTNYLFLKAMCLYL